MTVTTSTPTERLVLPRRWLFGALAVALAAHAALLIGWLAGLAGSGLAHLRPSEWLPAFAGVAALVLAVGLFAPRRLVCIARLFVVALACALVGPGPVATVALMGLSGHVVGSALLDFVAKDHDRSPGSPGPAIRILAGTCVWMGVIAATITLPVHAAPVYALVLAISLAALPLHTRGALVAVRDSLMRDVACSNAERVWIALACAVVMLHLVVVAKPEVGYDATTMHLQFAELISH